MSMRGNGTAVSGQPRVLLLHEFVLQFRQGFHKTLRAELARRGIQLSVVHGYPHGGEATKQDAITIDWARQVRTKVVHLGRKELVWVPTAGCLRSADLVIVPQQSKQLLNYMLFAQQMLGYRRMALWGHGRNLDEHGRSHLGEALKSLMSRRVHWWFAYNDLSARVVSETGFPADRITSVRNAIDTRSMLREAETVSASEVEALRRHLGVRSHNVCLYVGGMYDLKRLPFLLDACLEIRTLVPDFEMVFLGAGPDSHLVSHAAAQHEWLHAVGPVFGREKLAYFKMSKLLLLPGRVGLAILDAFTLETPLVTVEDAAHSPEIDYLEPGTNGVMLPAGTRPRDYAAAVARLLGDDRIRQPLVEGGRRAREHYSIEGMAQRFADGVEKALRAPPLRRRRAVGAKPWVSASADDERERASG